MSAPAARKRDVLSRAVALSLAAIGCAGCADTVVASRAEGHPRPATLSWELTPLQRQLSMRPVSPEAAAGRPATRADLEEARSWFGPGELEAVLAVVNGAARAAGADTLPHCVPLCDPGFSGAERAPR